MAYFEQAINLNPLPLHLIFKVLPVLKLQFSPIGYVAL